MSLQQLSPNLHTETIAHWSQDPRKVLFSCDVHHPRAQRAPLFSGTGVGCTEAWPALGQSSNPQRQSLLPSGMVTSLGTLCASNTHLLSFHITCNHLQLIISIKMPGFPPPRYSQEKKRRTHSKYSKCYFCNPAGRGTSSKPSPINRGPEHFCQFYLCTEPEAETGLVSAEHGVISSVTLQEKL